MVFFLVALSHILHILQLTLCGGGGGGGSSGGNIVYIIIMYIYANITLYRYFLDSRSSLSMFRIRWNATNHPQHIVLQDDKLQPL